MKKYVLFVFITASIIFADNSLYQGFVDPPAEARPFRRMIPLAELLSHTLNSGIMTQKVQSQYHELIKNHKNQILLSLEIVKKY